MTPIGRRMRKSSENYIFHDAKKDIGILMDYCNMLADKVNELNAEVQDLRKQLKEE
jgi:hypothetical protein